MFKPVGISNEAPTCFCMRSERLSDHVERNSYLASMPSVISCIRRLSYEPSEDKNGFCSEFMNASPDKLQSCERVLNYEKLKATFVRLEFISLIEHAVKPSDAAAPSRVFNSAFSSTTTKS